MEEKIESTSDSTEQELLQNELERVKKNERSELEKAAFSLKKNAERVKNLGGDPDTILGKREVSDDDDENQPVTLGMLKKLQAETAAKTAIGLAEEISNEAERELVKYHLSNTIRSTGNPQEDLRLARSLVNSVKNSQVVEEISRKSEVKSHSSASGANARTEDKQIEFTQAEINLMRHPFNLTKEEILAAREKDKNSQK